MSAPLPPPTDAERVVELPDDDGPWIDCWSCGGEGREWDCIDGRCLDQDDPYCLDCSQPYSVCKGKGGWPEADPGVRPGETTESSALAQREIARG